MIPWYWLIVAIVIGNIIGIYVAAFCMAAGEDDRKMGIK